MQDAHTSPSLNTNPAAFAPVVSPLQALLELGAADGLVIGNAVGAFMQTLSEQTVRAFISVSNELSLDVKQELLIRFERVCADKTVVLSDRVAAAQALSVLVKCFTARTIGSLDSLLTSLEGSGAEAQRSRQVVAATLCLAIEYGPCALVQELAFRTYANQSWYHSDLAGAEKAMAALARSLSSSDRLYEFAVQMLARDNFAEATVLLSSLCHPGKGRQIDQELLVKSSLALLNVHYRSGLEDELLLGESERCLMTLSGTMDTGSLAYAQILLDLALVNERQSEAASRFALPSLALVKSVCGDTSVEFTRFLDKLSQIGLTIDHSELPCIEVAMAPLPEPDCEPELDDDIEMEIESEPVQTLAQTLQDFLDNLPDDGMKEATRRAYRSRVQQVMRFIDKRYAGEAAPAADQLGAVLAEFIAHSLADGSLNSVSIQNFLSTFKHVAKSMGQRLECAPVDAGAAAAASQPPVVLNEKQVADLLRVAAAESSSRSLALILLFLNTPIKIGECTRLAMEDLSWTDGVLRIKLERVNRVSLLPIPIELRDALQNWLLERGSSLSGESSDYVFFGRDRGSITTGAMDAALRKVGWKAGLEISATVLHNTYVSQSRSRIGARKTAAPVSNVAEISGYNKNLQSRAGSA